MAQQKKTEIFELPELPVLTEKQNDFVARILAGERGPAAYRAAYDTSGSDRTVAVEASRLLNNPDIALTLAVMRMQGMGATGYDLSRYIQELEADRELAKKTGNIGAAVQALQLIGKALGHFTEKLEVSSPDPLMSLDEIAAKFGSKVAQAVADEEGIPWETKH